MTPPNESPSFRACIMASTICSATFLSGNTFGQLFRITTWGESHGPGIGVVVDGCPAGLPLSEKDIQVELDRRRTGQSKVTTTRKEPDQIRFLSGIFNGKTTGTPLAMMVENRDKGILLKT